MTSASTTVRLKYTCCEEIARPIIIFQQPGKTGSRWKWRGEGIAAWRHQIILKEPEVHLETTNHHNKHNYWDTRTTRCRASQFSEQVLRRCYCSGGYSQQGDGLHQLSLQQRLRGAVLFLYIYTECNSGTCKTGSVSLLLHKAVSPIPHSLKQYFLLPLTENCASQ